MSNERNALTKPRNINNLASHFTDLDRLRTYISTQYDSGLLLVLATPP